MSDEPTLTPQVPGELTVQEPGLVGTVDQAKIDALAAGNVVALTEALAALTTDELEALQLAETAGKARTTALSAIATELSRRDADANVIEHEPPVPQILGNAEDFKHQAAKDVDPSKITRPVLTRDGWVLPLPKAEPGA